MKQVQIRALKDLLKNLSKNNSINNNSILISTGLKSVIESIKTFSLNEQMILVEEGIFLFGKLGNLKIFLDKEMSSEICNIYDLGKNVIFHIDKIKN